MKALLLTLAASTSVLLAEDVTLDWVSSGFSPRIGYYIPQRVELSSEKPAHVTKLPEGIKEPKFATIAVGTAAEEKKIVLLLDESAWDQSRLWLDANGNGDLTDDPMPKWSQQPNRWQGSATMQVDFDGQERQLGIQLYRFNPADAQRAALKNTLLYYRDFGLAGKITLGGKTYSAVLSDEKARGDFVGSGDARLGLDLNEDKKFNSRAETFPVTKPFNIGGTTYEIEGLKPGGNTFQIVKSEESVAEKAVPVAAKLGTKVTPFEEQTIEGSTIRFPQDYKGKVVLLDFWATWCGPCVAEVPNLKKVYEDLQAKGFEILGISLDNEQTMPKLKPFLEEKGIAWPQIADGKGWESKLAGVYGVSQAPTYFLVDGTTGQLVATSEDLKGAALRPTVEHALANIGNPSAAANRPARTQPSQPEDPLVKKARSLAEKGELMTAEKFLDAVKRPTASPIALRPAGTNALRGREIADRASAAHVRVGWIFQCTKCTRWHTNLAGGYAIARDTVVTANHVLEAPENMKPGTGTPVIVRDGDKILPIRSVIAAEAASDTMILRVGADDLQPLSLANDVRTGDTVFCLSDPRGVTGYFSSGIVNRRFTRDQGKADDPRDQRLHVSTDWAQGSSGAAVLDEYGNVVGHVARIRTILGPRQPSTNTSPSLMSLHEAVPATCVLRLVEQFGVEKNTTSSEK